MIYVLLILLVVIASTSLTQLYAQWSSVVNARILAVYPWMQTPHGLFIQDLNGDGEYELITMIYGPTGIYTLAVMDLVNGYTYTYDTFHLYNETPYIISYTIYNREILVLIQASQYDPFLNSSTIIIKLFVIGMRDSRLNLIYSKTYPTISLDGMIVTVYSNPIPSISVGKYIIFRGYPYSFIVDSENDFSIVEKIPMVTNNGISIHLNERLTYLESKHIFVVSLGGYIINITGDNLNIINITDFIVDEYGDGRYGVKSISIRSEAISFLENTLLYSVSYIISSIKPSNNEELINRTILLTIKNNHVIRDLKLPSTYRPILARNDIIIMDIENNGVKIFKYRNNTLHTLYNIKLREAIEPVNIFNNDTNRTLLFISTRYIVLIWMFGDNISVIELPTKIFTNMTNIYPQYSISYISNDRMIIYTIHHEIRLIGRKGSVRGYIVEYSLNTNKLYLLDECIYTPMLLLVSTMIIMYFLKKRIS